MVADTRNLPVPGNASDSGYRAGAVDNLHANAGELFAKMSGGRLYHEAYEAGYNLSTFLEEEDPSEDGDHLDAFGRMLRYAKIRVNGDPGRGYWSDRFDKFEQNEESRALVPEWTARIARQVRYGRPMQADGQRLFYSSDEFSLGSVMRPYVDNAQARFFQLAPAIPLAEVVSITTPIEGDAYRAFYLTNDTNAQRMYRVTEGAELPRARLTGGDHTIRLHKFGRALEVSYEQLRRQRIDIVALHIARMAVQAEIDKVSAVLDVMVNGDGNASTAATVYNLTTLDSGATAGTLSLKGWLAFKLKFTNPYSITHAIAQDAVVEQAMLLDTGTANIPLMFLPANAFGAFAPINPGLADNVRIGHTTAAPSLKIVGFDRRWGIERVTEIGGDITEIDRWVIRQTQVLTLSEVEGYAVFDQFAVKVLDVNA